MFPRSHRVPRSSATRLSLFAFPVAVSLAATLAACGGSGGGDAVAQPAAPAVTAPPMSPGQQVYDKSCARCHGANLQGKDDAPALDAARLGTLGDQTLRLAITFGKGRMKGFSGLSTTQVDDLVAYLRSTQ